MSNFPRLRYWCEGDCKVELAVPSPHDHSHEVGVLVLESVQVTELGIRMKFFVQVNDATGADTPDEYTISKNGA